MYFLPTFSFVYISFFCTKSQDVIIQPSTFFFSDDQAGKITQYIENTDDWDYITFKSQMKMYFNWHKFENQTFYFDYYITTFKNESSVHWIYFVHKDSRKVTENFESAWLDPLFTYMRYGIMTHSLWPWLFAHSHTRLYRINRTNGRWRFELFEVGYSFNYCRRKLHRVISKTH